MRNITIAFFLFFFSLTASAVGCGGKVTTILDWNAQCKVADPAGYLVSHLAYKFSGTNNVWICSNSDTTDALVMMAYANKVSVTINLPGTSCTNRTHYTQPNYIAIQPF